MSNEKAPVNKVEHGKASKELEAVRQEAQENIDRLVKHEKEQVKSKAERLDEARLEAEKASEAKERRQAEKVAHPEKRQGPISRKAREAAFKKTMSEVRSEMSPASRAFSKIIHNPAVENTSEVIGNTVARPNAILAGSVAAFILTAVVYLVARHYGYALSGAETIAAFILGWAIGLIYDYVRILVLGKER